MIKVLFLFFLLVFGASCTSSGGNSKAKPKEAVSQSEDDYEDDYGDDEGEESSKSSGTKPARMTSAQKKTLSRVYKVGVPFEKIVKVITAAIKAKPNDNSIYDFDVEFDFFPDGKLDGDVQVLSKKGDKTFKVDSARKSRLKKHFFVGKKTKKGFCGACFFNTDHISLTLGAAYYEKPGPSSAFYASSIRFIKGGAKRTHIAVNANSSLKSANKVTGFTMKKKTLELLYLDKDKTQHKIEIMLNETLDVTASYKAKGQKEFITAVVLKGGKAPEYATK